MITEVLQLERDGVDPLIALERVERLFDRLWLNGARDALRRMVAAIQHETPCGNARSVENRISAAIAAQSTRLSAEQDVATGGRLFQLTAADFAAAAAAAERAAKATALSE